MQKKTNQGCQIFVRYMHQNGTIFTKNHKIYQVAIEYTKMDGKYSK
jgi:hypothetical protein